MAIYLGDLSVRQLESRCQITLTDEERSTLENIIEHTCDKVGGNNKIHIFDIPFLVKCGNQETQQVVLDILMPYASEMKASLQVGYVD